ncbi:glutamate racemase, partial [Streptomyces sp. NPDC059900]
SPVHPRPAPRARFHPARPDTGTGRANPPAGGGGAPDPMGPPPATTGSPYQRGLIEEFAGGVEVAEVPCPGLADAVQYADEAAIDRAVAAAAALTPRDVRAVVLGCTHYELVGERIRAALQQPGMPPLVLHGSAGAVAAQALRRTGELPGTGAGGEGGLTVILSGRAAELPAAAHTYAEGRLLAAVSSAH